VKTREVATSGVFSTVRNSTGPEAFMPNPGRRFGVGRGEGLNRSRPTPGHDSRPLAGERPPIYRSVARLRPECAFDQECLYGLMRARRAAPPPARLYAFMAVLDRDAPLIESPSAGSSHARVLVHVGQSCAARVYVPQAGLAEAYRVRFFNV